MYEFEIYKAGSSNLALNHPAFSSSSETVDLGPEKAVDGNISSRWASGNPEAGAGGWPVATTNPDAGSSDFFSIH